MDEYDKTRLLELIIDYAKASIWLEMHLNKVRRQKDIDFWEEEKRSCWNHINKIIEKE